MTRAPLACPAVRWRAPGLSERACVKAHDTAQSRMHSPADAHACTCMQARRPAASEQGLQRGPRAGRGTRSRGRPCTRTLRRSRGCITAPRRALRRPRPLWRTRLPTQARTPPATAAAGLGAACGVGSLCRAVQSAQVQSHCIRALEAITHGANPGSAHHAALCFEPHLLTRHSNRNHRFGTTE